MSFTIKEILIFFKLFYYSHAQGLRRLAVSYVAVNVESNSQIESSDEKNGKKKNNADQSEMPVLILWENEAREVLKVILVF